MDVSITRKKDKPIDSPDRRWYLHILNNLENNNTNTFFDFLIFFFKKGNIAKGNLENPPHWEFWEIIIWPKCDVT